MKRLMFIVSLVFCLFCTPLVGFANPTEEEKAKYEEAISEKYIEMLKGSIALDKSNAELTTYLVTWLEAEKQPREAKKIVAKIDALKAEQAKSLLVDTDMSIETIAVQVGFNSLTYFDRVFHKLTGLSPQVYRSSVKK